MTPKVSVVIPVYNAVSYLKECLDSIVNQTLKEIEIICVNDGSTDNSLEILNEYAAKDNRFKIIDQKNAGTSPSRNTGIDASCGDYLMIVDHDDFFEDNMLEYLYYTAKAEQSDAVICGFYVYNNQTHEDVQIEYPLIPGNLCSPFEPKDLSGILFNISANPAWTKLWKAELIKKNNISFDDVPYCNDVYFSCLGLACSQKISFTNIPFVHWRTFNDKQMTVSGRPETLAPLLKTYSKLYDSLVEKGLYETYQEAYKNRVLSSAQYEFFNGMGKDRKKSLLCIPQELPVPVVQELFAPKDRPAVSLVLAVYNMEKWLSQCLDSLINQTLKNIEIICVDDGSTDGSLKVLQDYAAKDNRIKVLTQTNQKLPLARRHAMEIATGEYIQYVDADDYLELNASECLYLYSKLYNLDMCFFMGENFTEGYARHLDSGPMQLKWMPDNFSPVFTYKNLKNILIRVNVGSCLTFYRHDFLKKNHIEWIKEALCYEDTPFFIESLLRAKRVGALKETFYHRRKHADAITEKLDTNFPDFLAVVLKALTLMKKYADELTLNNYFKDASQNALNVYRWLCTDEGHKKFKTNMYDFFSQAKKIHDGSYSKDVKNWCKTYEKRLKKI